MKTICYAILLIILMMTNTSVLACKGTEVLFQDDFTKLDSSWGVSNDVYSVSNNMFILQPNLNSYAFDINQSNVFQDMDYCVDVKLLKGDDSTVGRGIIFWAKNTSDYYYLYIMGDGTYFVNRFLNGRILYPVPAQKDSSINTANGAVNHLRVVTKGTQATIYINDKQLVTFTGQPPEGGGLIGLEADSPASVRNSWGFSNLKITKPQ